MKCLVPSLSLIRAVSLLYSLSVSCISDLCSTEDKRRHFLKTSFTEKLQQKCHKTNATYKHLISLAAASCGMEIFAIFKLFKHKMFFYIYNGIYSTVWQNYWSFLRCQRKKKNFETAVREWTVFHPVKRRIKNTHEESQQLCTWI